MLVVTTVAIRRCSAIFNYTYLLRGLHEKKKRAGRLFTFRKEKKKFYALKVCNAFAEKAQSRGESHGCK